MRTLCVGLLAVGLAVLLARPAAAQPGRGGFGGMGQLLQQKAVQEDLKLDDDQIKKAKDAMDKVRADHKDELDKVRDPNSGLSMEERAEIFKKVAADTEKALKDVLKPEQMTRLKQIQLQIRGVEALSDEEVQKDLKLTSEQKDDIKTIVDDLRKQRGEVFRSIGGFDPDKMAEARKKMEAMNTEAMDKVGKVLKDDQKKSLDDMKGAKFDTSKLQFGPPRRPNQ